MRRLALILALFLGLVGLPAVAATPTVDADDMILGKANAPVTVFEYASTACPHCAAWNKDVWPAFKAKYVDTGKVRFVFRELITSPPQVAIAGPLLARCAGKDKYFAMIDGAFHAQEEVYKISSILPLVKVAEANGMTEDQVKACLGDQAAVEGMQTRVQAMAERDGVNSTPTFFVAGKKLEGEADLAAFDKAIAAAR